METKEKGPAKKRLFLETTAQISRLSGVSQKKKNVNSVIELFLQDDIDGSKGDKLVTSGIVYAEFLGTIVKDILLVRDMIKEEFLDKKEFSLRLYEVAECLEQYKKITPRRAKRIYLVVACLNKKFMGNKSIETKRIICYLDTLARDLALEDFFNIRGCGNKIQIEANSPCYLREIGCLRDGPLQEDCMAKDIFECRLKICEPYSGECRHLGKCFVTNTPITKCQKKPKQRCEIETFFKKDETLKSIKLLKKAEAEKLFSPDFRKKPKNVNWLKRLKECDCVDKEFQYKGRYCYLYFFDMLILLQCPGDTQILSSDKDYDELGRVIGRPEIRVSF